MPNPLTKSDVDAGNDPSVTKQYDYDTPKSEQFSDLYKIIDSRKTGLLTTIRSSIGPIARSMALAKRAGPDLLFLANINSQKFKDLEQDKTAQVTFQDSGENWVSVTGTVTTASNDDPKIKEIYSKGVNAWFGDLGDGVHTGGPEDPRMAMIEVKAKYIAYWKSTRTTIGFVKEVTQASMTGQVADTGVNRELTEEDIEVARKES